MKIPLKKKAAARPRIEISGDRSGECFERELAAIKRALKSTPFIAAGGCLRHVSAHFEWTVDRHVGALTTRLRRATIDDLRREARKRVRGVPRFHFEELIRRASRSRSANDCFPFLRVDSDGKIICSSPPLHFGQPRKFGNR